MEFLFRFLAGGFFVSAFSLAGESFKHKSYSGIFGAAPAVAISSLLLTYYWHGTGDLSDLGHSMLLGSFAMVAYSASCFVAIHRKHPRTWLSALGLWLEWVFFAFLLLEVFHR